VSVDARKILDEHPLFAKAITEFMMLLDAAEVLAELKPPMHETMAGYLREVADKHIRQATALPETFILAMIAARPPVTGRNPKEHLMAREPQREREPRHLDAKLVPVEHALLARAKAIEADAALAVELVTAHPGLRTADNVPMLTRMAAEFRALAEELHYW
jgi:hypothetical protein